MIDNKYNMSVNTFKLGSICRSSIQSYSISNKIRFTYYFSVLCTPFVFAYEWFFQCVFQFHFDNAKSCGPFVERERETIGLDWIRLYSSSEVTASARRGVASERGRHRSVTRRSRALPLSNWDDRCFTLFTTQHKSVRLARRRQSALIVESRWKQSRARARSQFRTTWGAPFHSIPFHSFRRVTLCFTSAVRAVQYFRQDLNDAFPDKITPLIVEGIVQNTEYNTNS